MIVMHNNNKRYHFSHHMEVDSHVLLLAFSAAMFAGAFGAGYIPLSCAISQARYAIMAEICSMNN